MAMSVEERQESNRAANRRFRARNLEKSRAADRAQYHKNIEVSRERRQCRECHNEQTRARYHRQKQAVLIRPGP